MVAAKAQTTVEIPAVKWTQATLTVKGVTPYLGNALGPLAAKGIAENFEKTKTKKKELPDVEALRDDTVHLTPEGNPCILASALKKAFVMAAGRVFDEKMTAARTWWEPTENQLELHFQKREPVLHIGRNRLRGLVPVYRWQFTGWGVDLPIIFDAKRTTLETIVTVLNAAGLYIGVGAWRPECSGAYGKFSLVE